jgi:hypothetical protein
MVLFLRAFIRKRVISLATSASVATISFVPAQDPARVHDVGDGVQYAAGRQGVSQALLPQPGPVGGSLNRHEMKMSR